MANNENKPKTSFKIPHTFVIMFTIIVLAAICTWIIPAGQFDRVEDPASHKVFVVAGSFKYIESTPVGFFNTFVAVQKGMVDAAPIIFFIFIVYTSFYIVIKTGTLNNAIAHAIKKMRGKENLMIPISMYIFGLAGAIFGMFEETFGFIPILVSLAIALGYDALVGMCMVSFGVAMGFAAAFMNPFTVGVAQGIATLPLFSGMAFRIVSFLVFETLAVWWTIRYAAKIKKNPDASLVKDIDYSTFKLNHDDLDAKFTGRQMVILGVIGLTIVVLVYGVLELGWYIDQLAGLFLIMGIVCGLIGGFAPSKIAEYFIEGCKDMVFGAFAVDLCFFNRVQTINREFSNVIQSGVIIPWGSSPES